MRSPVTFRTWLALALGIAVACQQPPPHPSTDPTNDDSTLERDTLGAVESSALATLTTERHAPAPAPRRKRAPRTIPPESEPPIMIAAEPTPEPIATVALCCDTFAGGLCMRDVACGAATSTVVDCPADDVREIVDEQHRSAWVCHVPATR